MLFGRHAERVELDEMLVVARAGRAVVAVLLGEAGVGKSTLVAHAARNAEATRMTVAGVSGIEPESAMPYATLGALLPSLAPHLGALPGWQARVLRDATAVAPGAPVDRHAVGAALLALIGAAAEAAPLLVTVDDLHWVDRATAEALLFAGRRLTDEPVMLLLAARAEARLPAALPDTARPIALTGLDRRAAGELLNRAAGGRVAGPVAEALMAATGGNPLALIEMGRTAADGAGPLPSVVPALPVGERIERAFGARLAPLPQQTIRALLIAAFAISSRTEVVRRACAACNVDPGRLRDAETAGIVAIEGRTVAWRHPLMRSVVAQRAAPSERRTIHAALAACEDGDARAWHLAAAADGPDERAAAALEETAGRHLHRGAADAAATAMLQAARLSPARDAHARRSVEAASVMARSGRHREGLAVLDELGAEGETIPALRARAAILAGAGMVREARAVLVPRAESLAASDPPEAASLLTAAAMSALPSGDTRAVLDLSGRALELLDRARTPAPERLTAEAVAAQGLLMQGRTADGRRMLSAAVRAARRGDRHPVLIPAAAMGLLWLGDHTELRSLLVDLVAEARAASAVGALPYPLAVLAIVEFRDGHWTAALAAAAEAVDLAEATEQPANAALALVACAHVEAGRGILVDAERHLDAAEAIAAATGVDSLLLYCAALRGLLQLSAGWPDAAAGHLLRADAMARDREVAHPTVLRSGGDLVEALVRAGRVQEAREALRSLEEAASRTGCAWTRAAAARCDAMLRDGEDAEAAYRRALALHGAAVPFGRARTALLLGEHLRRLRRPGDARIPLHEARDAFLRLGARPWAERAARELEATGERLGTAPGRDVPLTPQETRIALAVARGATNPEIAAELLISRKTVEHHLTRIYAKAGLRSRTALAVWMRDAAD